MIDEGQIREYIRANLAYFGQGGLGWQRPGGLPKYYLQHPDEWADDLAMVEYLRKTEAARARAAAASNGESRGLTTASSGLCDETKLLFESIKKMDKADRDVPEIAVALSMPERCVRNALALSHSAENPESEALDHGPEVGLYLGGVYKWPKGNGSSNGHGNKTDHGLRG